MGFQCKVKFPIISNHFAKCAHKGELPAVFSAIYYLNKEYCLYDLVYLQQVMDMQISQNHDSLFLEIPRNC